MCFWSPNSLRVWAAPPTLGPSLGGFARRGLELTAPMACVSDQLSQMVRKTLTLGFPPEIFPAPLCICAASRWLAVRTTCWEYLGSNLPCYLCDLEQAFLMKTVKARAVQSVRIRKSGKVQEGPLSGLGLRIPQPDPPAEPEGGSGSVPCLGFGTEAFAIFVLLKGQRLPGCPLRTGTGRGAGELSAQRRRRRASLLSAGGGSEGSWVPSTFPPAASASRTRAWSPVPLSIALLWTFRPCNFKQVCPQGQGGCVLSVTCSCLPILEAGRWAGCREKSIVLNPPRSSRTWKAQNGRANRTAEWVSFLELRGGPRGSTCLVLLFQQPSWLCVQADLVTRAPQVWLR
ncbi:hypothetical protein Cadr_000028593 [Camelus dromedarius]|uniref:Uncharacterized protein n=1 Tax=Camelus dromedarius TaxID=9838 RepID=A0A5N4CHP9_CAMDR|nr:hypothetical protein Cadr_000028593 [Camelus dromedarius]